MSSEGEIKRTRVMTLRGERGIMDMDPEDQDEDDFRIEFPAEWFEEEGVDTTERQPVFYDVGVDMLGTQLLTTPGSLITHPVSESHDNLSQVRKGKSVMMHEWESSYTNKDVATVLWNRSSGSVVAFFSNGEPRFQARVFTHYIDEQPEYTISPLTAAELTAALDEEVVFTVDFSGWIRDSRFRVYRPKCIGAPGLYAIDGFVYGKHETDETAAKKLASVLQSYPEVRVVKDYTEYSKLPQQETLVMMNYCIEHTSRPYSWRPVPRLYGRLRKEGEWGKLAEVEQRTGIMLSTYLTCHAHQWIGKGGKYSMHMCGCGCKSVTQKNYLAYSHYWAQRDIDAGYAVATMPNLAPKYDPALDFTVYQKQQYRQSMPKGATAQYYQHWQAVGSVTNGGAHLWDDGNFWIDRIKKVPYDLTIVDWVSKVIATQPRLWPGICAWEGVLFKIERGKVVSLDLSSVVPSTPRKELLLSYLKAIGSRIPVEVHSRHRPLHRMFNISPMLASEAHRVFQMVQTHKTLARSILPDQIVVYTDTAALPFFAPTSMTVIEFARQLRDIGTPFVRLGDMARDFRGGQFQCPIVLLRDPQWFEGNVVMPRNEHTEHLQKIGVVEALAGDDIVPGLSSCFKSAPMQLVLGSLFHPV